MTATFTPAPPPNQVINGDFSSGLNNWLFLTDVSRSVVNGVLNAYRANASSYGVFKQNMTSFSAAPGQVLEASFRMGNSSAVTKNVQVFLTSYTGGGAGSFYCEYVVPPGAPLTAYRMIGPAGAGWTGTGVSIHFAIVQPDNRPTLLFDDVAVRQYPFTKK